METVATARGCWRARRVAHESRVPVSTLPIDHATVLAAFQKFFAGTHAFGERINNPLNDRLNDHPKKERNRKGEEGRGRDGVAKGREDGRESGRVVKPVAKNWRISAGIDRNRARWKQNGPGVGSAMLQPRLKQIGRIVGCRKEQY